MKESATEKLLRREVEERGGFCIKLDPAGYVGIPDRLVVLPGEVMLVEVKRGKGGKIAPLQHWWAERLTSLGAQHHFVVGDADVLSLMGAYDARSD